MQSEVLRSFSQSAQYPKHVHVSLRITSHSSVYSRCNCDTIVSRPRNKKIIRRYTSLQYWWRYMRQCYNI